MKRSLFALLFLFLYPVVHAQGVDSDGTLVVLNKADNTASIIDVKSGETLDVLPTGVGPHEAAVSPDGAIAVVGDYGDQTPGNTLTIFDLKKLEVSRKIDLGEFQRPHGIEFLDADRVVVTAEVQQKVTVINLKTGLIELEIGTEQAASHMVVVDAERKMAYTANIVPGTVSVLNLVTGQLETNIEVESGIEGIGITPDGSEVWVANRNTHKVTAIDTDKRQIIATMECRQLPFRVKFTPDGQYALVANAISGNVAVFDVAKKELKETVSLKNMEWEGQTLDNPTPVGLITDTEGRYLYVNCLTLNKVAAVNLESMKVEALFKTGNIPDGIAYSPFTSKK